MLNCSAIEKLELRKLPSARVKFLVVLGAHDLEGVLRMKNLISTPFNFDSRSYIIISSTISWKKLGGVGW